MYAIKKPSKNGERLDKRPKRRLLVSEQFQIHLIKNTATTVVIRA